MSHLYCHNDNEEEKEIVRPSDGICDQLGENEAYHDRRYVKDIRNHSKLVIPNIDRPVTISSIPPNK